MPLQFPRRKISDAENRLRVLFCLNALGMATLDQLWPFVALLELMEYLQLCVFVDELKKDGALSIGAHALEGMLYLTDEGRKTLALFSGKMPRTERERILKAAQGYCAQLSENRQVRAAHERAADGEYRVACTVQEGDIPTLFLKLMTSKKQLASSAMRHFRETAAHILLLLYTLPTAACQAAQPPAPPEIAESPEAAMLAAAPGKPTLCAYGKHEHSAVVCLRCADAVYRVSLLMPSREAAEQWAAASLAVEAELADKLTAALTQRGLWTRHAE